VGAGRLPPATGVPEGIGCCTAEDSGGVVTAKADTTGAFTGPEGPEGWIFAGGISSRESSLRERFCCETEASIGAMEGDVVDELCIDFAGRT